MALVDQLINQRAKSSPRACCFFHQQRVASLGPDVHLHQSQPFRHPNPDTFSRFAASSATTSSREFASMWWKAILFCLMTDGPASSKCDLTLIKSVTPLRSSISWKRIDHKSPLGPCTRSHLCAMHLVTYFASIGIWIFDFPSTLLRIWIAPQSSARGTVCLPGT